MRNVIVFINMCILGLVAMVALDTEKDTPLVEPVVATGAAVEAGVDKNSNSLSPVLAGTSANVSTGRFVLSAAEEKEVSDFILWMEQGRLMELEQASLASQRGTDRSLKDFGAWMVIQQKEMLEEVTRIGRLRRIHTTRELDAARNAHLSEIQKLHGKKFDARYLKAVSASLKKDIKALERASYSKDPEVQVFAARYISITKDNLAKAQQLRKNSRWMR